MRITGANNLMINTYANTTKKDTTSLILIKYLKAKKKATGSFEPLTYL